MMKRRHDLDGDVVRTVADVSRSKAQHAPTHTFDVVLTVDVVNDVVVPGSINLDGESSSRIREVNASNERPVETT